MCLSHLCYLLPGIKRLKRQEHHGLTWWQLFLVFISFAIGLGFQFFWSAVATPLASHPNLPTSYPQQAPDLSWTLIWFQTCELLLLYGSCFKQLLKIQQFEFLRIVMWLSFGFGNFLVIWSVYWKVFWYFSFVQFFYSIHHNAGLLWGNPPKVLCSEHAPTFSWLCRLLFLFLHH